MIKKFADKVKELLSAANSFKDGMAQDPRYGPYIRLMRFQDMTGTWLMLFPIIWSILLGNRGIFFTTFWLIVFSLGTVVMRAAGCIINDIFDRELDSQVARTANRPLASKELTLGQALKALMALLGVGGIVMLILSFKAAFVAMVFFAMAIAYPKAKKFMELPQLFLGFTFNGGIIVAWLAMHNWIGPTAIMLYLGAVSWTFAYDTIYAYQDYEDDLRLGNVNSAALKFGLDNNKWLFNCYSIALIMWFFAGFLSGMHLIYYIVLAIVGMIFFTQARNIDFRNKEMCYRYFRQNTYVGPILALGILLDRLLL